MDRRSPQIAHPWPAVVLAVTAILLGSMAAAGAAVGWFGRLQPNGQCPVGDQLCGIDYTQAAIAVDHTTGITLINILVRPGTAGTRLSGIAAAVARKNPARRVIVYVLRDLAPGPMAAGFAGIPADDAAPAVPPPAKLTPYLVLTYDQGPAGLRQTP